MNVYVVVIDDRHSDIDLAVFDTEDGAIEYAAHELNQMSGNPEDIEIRMNDAMASQDWVWHATYSCENDSITVIKRQLQQQKDGIA